MQKIWNSLTSMYQFLRLEAWKRTQLGSLMPWQANGMIISLWIALKLCFQFFNFLTKMQSWFLIWGADSRFLCIRFWSVYVCQWIRVGIWVKRSMQSWIKYWILMAYFFNLFHVFLVSIMAKSFPFLMCTNLQWPMRANAA